MKTLFEDYQLVLLDSTFFKKELTEDVKTGLLNTNVFCADTLITEVKQYRLLLGSRKTKVYDDNLAFLRSVKKNTLDFSTFGDKTEHLNNDIWGLTKLLIGMNARFAVLTSNKLLIQRIMINHLPVDIYDFNLEQLIRHDQFYQYTSQFVLEPLTNETVNLPTGVKEGSTVRLGNNNEKVVLGKAIRSGNEANLYLIKDHPEMIAKIYKDGKFSKNKFNNTIKVLGKSNEMDIDWALFPDQMLFENNNPVGITESYVNAKFNFDNNPLFFGDPYNIDKVNLEKKQSYIIDLCLKIVRQVCYLNVNGFYISDYNISNFSLVNENDDNIQMWDTDSFGYDTYFENIFSSQYIEGISHTKYDLTTKEGAIEICYDALDQFIFMMLSLGDYPISKYKQTFKYDNPNYPSVIKKNFIIDNIWNHLADVFRGEKEPSPEALMNELIRAQEYLHANPGQNKTIKQLHLENIPDYKEYLEEMSQEELNKILINETDKNIASGSTKDSKSTTGSNSNQGPKPKPKPSFFKRFLKFVLIVIILLVIVAVIAASL